MKRKSFKQIISTVLLFMFVVSSVACGNTTQTNSQDTIDPKITDKADTSATSTAQDTIELSWWGDKMPEDIVPMIIHYTAANPNVKVNYEQIPYADYAGTKLTSAFAAGDGPDIFFVSAADIGKHLNSGVGLPLDTYISDKAKSDFNISSLDAVKFDGKIYAIPFEMDLVGLYYDVDALASIGATVPKTWDETKTIALKYKEKFNKPGIAFETPKGGYQIFTWYPFMWMTGADIFTPDYKDSGLSNPGVAKALNFWRDLIASGAAAVKTSRPSSDIGIVAEGECPMLISGSWSISDIEKKYAKKNIGVAPLPIPEGGKPASVGGGWKVMVNKSGKAPEVAAELVVSILASDDISQCIFHSTVQNFNFSPRKSVVDAAQDFYTKGLRAVFSQQIYGTEKPEIRMPGEVSIIIQDMVQDALFKMTGEEAAKKADERLKDFLKNYKGQI